MGNHQFLALDSAQTFWYNILERLFYSWDFLSAVAG
jgi:hypothetical protein